jgi:hypothetical protein
MSTRYTVQNNQKGYWTDWAIYQSRENAIGVCTQMSKERVSDVDNICSWRVIKEETVQIYPQGIAND